MSDWSFTAPVNVVAVEKQAMIDKIKELEKRVKELEKKVALLQKGKQV